MPGPADAGSPDAGSEAAGGFRGPVTLVTGTTGGGTGAHVRMLAAGLAARGLAVSVLAPAAVGARFGFAALDRVTFTPVEFGERPRPRDVLAIGRLRRELRRDRRGDPRGGVVHAHGLRAGALSALALGRGRGARRPRLVVTVHNAPPSGRKGPVLIYRLLERLVARRADLVLGVSADLEARLRAAGARRTGRAVVPAAVPVPSGTDRAPGSGPDGDQVAVAIAAGRPLVLGAGRLASQKGFGTLLEAAPSWSDLDPEPLLALAGEGPLAGELRARAAALALDVAFLGYTGDIATLLAAAAVLVVPSRWEGQPLIVQEALRAAVPIVASRVGGIPGLVGEDAAVLVAPGDAPGLAAAVRAVLTDPELAGRLRAAARRRAASLPTPQDAVAAALTGYAEVAR